MKKKKCGNRFFRWSKSNASTNAKVSVPLTASTDSQHPQQQLQNVLHHQHPTATYLSNQHHATTVDKTGNKIGQTSPNFCFNRLTHQQQQSQHQQHNPSSINNNNDPPPLLLTCGSDANEVSPPRFSAAAANNATTPQHQFNNNLNNYSVPSSPLPNRRHVHNNPSESAYRHGNNANLTDITIINNNRSDCGGGGGDVLHTGPIEDDNKKHQSKHNDTNDKKKKTSTKLTTRISECIPACTARNESCEPPPSRTNTLRSSQRRRSASLHRKTPSVTLTASDSSQLLLFVDSINNNNSVAAAVRPHQLQCNSSSSSFLTNNNYQIMDRSVDSIGDCSLDVDAESTDFSDTSGSLNLLTPSSGKDFTREFTSRIHERCQLIGRPLTSHQVTTVLDANSGKISTILSVDEPPQSPSPPPEIVTSPIKKPSYLNLACCVNGYSNLTTYDSKLRQNINKSREVSPIRPIIHTLQYNRGETNYLVVPQYQPPPQLQQHYYPAATDITNDKISPRREIMMESRQSFLQTEMTTTISSTTTTGNSKTSTTTLKTMKKSTSGQDGGTLNGGDVTDCTVGYTNGHYKEQLVRSTVLVPDVVGSTLESKSFIQQRVERLYGPSALAQGFYSPKKATSGGRTSNGNSPITGSRVLSENLTNVKRVLHHNINNVADSSMDHLKSVDEQNSENINLPVMRHLRPEFRAQLPLLSPKRSNVNVCGNNVNVKKLSSNTVNSDDCDVVIKLEQIKAQQQQQTAQTTTLTTTQTLINGNSGGVPCGAVTQSNGVNGGDQVVSGVSDPGDSIKLQSSTPTPTPILANGGAVVVDAELDQIPVVPVVMKTTSKVPNGDVDMSQGGLYFLEILKTERDRMMALSALADSYMQTIEDEKTDVSDDVMGYLRSAAGKSRLLATQKMRQFEGLCHNNLNQSPDEKFPTTEGDLQGFWDMVLLQVDHIDELFKEIELFRSNNWKQPDVKKIPVAARSARRMPAVKSATPAVSNNNNNNIDSTAAAAAAAQKKSIATQRREAQRKQMMEMKRKQKEALATAAAEQNIEIFVNTTDAVDGGVTNSTTNTSASAPKS